MKYRAIPRLAWCAASLAVLLSARQLTDVHSVYLFPMSHGLDQYVANRLTSDHVFDVVSDPKKADAVFTDRLGPEFEYQLDHMNDPPKAPAPSKSAVKEKNDKSDTISSAPETHDNSAPVVSTFSRGKGNIFLVDAKSKQVLWSIYEPPKSTSPNDLNKTARRIVDELHKTIAPKPKAS